MTRSLSRKVRGGNVMLKIDMSKEYDQVDWHFLEHVLRVMGFLEFFCKLVSMCFHAIVFDNDERYV